MAEPVVRFRYDGAQLAEGVYGIVTAMAVTAALADGSTDTVWMAVAAFGTALALAMTHIYAYWIVESHGNGPHQGLRNLIHHQLPVLVGPALIGAAMILADELGSSIVTAAELAMWVGVVSLFLLGFRISRYSGRGYGPSIAIGLVDAAFGALIVLIKIAVH